MAFLTKIKASTDIYYYVSVYKKKEQYSTKNEERIFSLGCKKKAKKTLEKWNKNFNYVPDDLIEKGIQKEQLKKWLEQINNN